MASQTETSNQDLKKASPVAELAAAQLRGAAPLSAEELTASAHGTDESLLGQQRALDAIELGISIAAPGYNVYITGLRPHQERGPILALLRQKAATLPTPGDWVYVNNFQSPEAPKAIYLKSGQGRELRDAMSDLINFVREQLPKAFRNEDFDQERTALRDKYNSRAQEMFGRLEQHARERGFVIQAGPGGQLLFLPMVEGRAPQSPEELQKSMAQLPEAERQRLAKSQGELQDELTGILARQQEIMQELVRDVRAVERAFAGRLISPAVAALSQRFINPAVTLYLEQVVEHMLGNLDRFRESAEARSMGPEQRLPASVESAQFVEYQVNLLVDNAETAGAPVISENSPTYRNLFGTIERWVDPMGRVSSNFMRIVPGSYEKAHGGFLVIDLEDAIIEPGVWKMIKRSLNTGSVTIETFEPFSFFSLSGLKPESIQIDAKVIVLGGRFLYNLLYFNDPDFAELFKIKAEIRPVVEADRATVASYATRIASVANRESLPPFDGGAMAKVVEWGMRAAGERGRLLSMMEPIDDLVRESAYFARARGADRVQTAHVEQAIVERKLRLNYLEEEIRRLIAERILVIEIDGARVGQINGLAVLDAGGYAFGRPSRVTASVAMGQAGIINVERESRLSGSTHDKGVMILTGYLRSRFGQKHPLAMSASICFEQSYSGIDGDSASSTELYALLSALSDLPLRQDLAVTGSVDQHGLVQAIGGANEKIEGFYRICKVMGLTGKQGVLIPRSNVNNLMLEPEVVEAVEKGQFHVYPIETIQQGIELLTGIAAGNPDEPGTVDYLVDQRLRAMSTALRGAAQETRIIHEPAQGPPPPTPPVPPAPPR